MGKLESSMSVALVDSPEQFFTGARLVEFK